MSNHPIDFLPELIDEYVQARDRRLELNRQADQCEKREAKLKKDIEDTLNGAGLVTGGGGAYRATLVSEVKPTATDWGLVQKYIIENNAFDLLQKRLTESAVKSRWEDNITIPGIVKFPVTKLSITKV